MEIKKATYEQLTRLPVRIIGAIKRQFFLHGKACFDNSNLSQEIFAIDTWRAVIYSLGDGSQTHTCDLSDCMETRLYSRCHFLYVVK